MTLTVENGSFAYRGRELLFEEISFRAGAGELVAVLGANGAGKTTLLRCVAGLLPWRTGAGYLDGTDIRSLGEREFWKRVSYVPQASGLPVSYTVLDSVLLGLSGSLGPFGIPGTKERAKVEKALEAVGISRLAGRHCDEISGGEQRMVLIARALVSDPELLILDEPESNLDFRNQLLILSVVKELTGRGITCVFNTHYPDHALRLADRALLLTNGRGLFGTPGEILTDKTLRAAFRVEAVIGRAETPRGSFETVIPLSVTDAEPKDGKR